MARLAWRGSRVPKGLAGVAAASRYQSWELREDGKVLATVDFDSNRHTYYWYGGVGETRHNSLWDGTTYTTDEQAKTAAKAFVQRAREG